MNSKANIVQLLKRAKALIENKEHWIQDDFAMTDENIVMDARSLSATKFCSIGALRHVCYPSDPIRPYLSYAVQLMSAGTEKNIAAFNDAPERTHEEIMELYEIAITWAKCEG